MHVTERFYRAVYGEVAGCISGLGLGLYGIVHAAHTVNLKSCQRTMSG